MKNVLFLLFISPFCAYAQSISTYVGNGNAGYAGDGGLATLSEIALTKGIDFDNQGNLLVCNANSVRKVNKLTGIITSIAGSDTASSLGGWGNGGPATCASLVEPYDVCVDKQGNYYIADYWTNRVRKVSATTGIIDIYAGSTTGNTGDGGPATAAKFRAGVVSVCIDTAQNYIYISDEWNYKIWYVNIITNVIRTFAGTGSNGFSGDGGPATAAQFSRVFGLGIDKQGNVYIGDWDNKRIRKVDITTGVVTTIAGNGTNGYGGDGGPATAAMLKKPTAICFDTCGNLYFSDEDNNCVRKITTGTGIITTIAGNTVPGFTGDGGPATAAQFNHPTGVCIDEKFNLYVGDYYNHRVRKVALGNCNGTGVVGIEKFNTVENGALIYPNPINNELHIENAAAKTTYVLSNVWGAVVETGRLKKGSNVIAVHQLPPGLYMLLLTDEEGKRMVHKVVKE